ncbi:MAG: CBS domain-containing protein, partial [Aureibaculum sp.]
VYTRKLAKEEGIFVGNSAGSAIKGLLQLKNHFKKDDVVVVIFHDHCSRYIAKIFNDDWMRERGFLEEEITVALDLIRNRLNEPLISAKTEELVSHAIDRMRQYDISQIPVEDSNGFVGSVDESDLFRLYFENKNIADRPIKEVMRAGFPIVKKNTSIDKISKLINKDNKAVLVDLENGHYQIITKYDVISAIR